jgi:transcriptional regulator
MYVPEIYRGEDRAECIHLMRQYPLATVSGLCGKRIQSSHIPLVAREQDDGTLVLTGHIAKDNALAHHLDGQELSVHFHGPQAYLTPYWYSHLGHFPTWIYAAVHIYGRAQILDGRDLREHLKALIKQQEDVTMPDGDWHIGMMPADLTHHLARMIIGFKVEVDEIQPCFRLNQAKPKADIEALIANLSKSDCRTERALAAMVQHHAGLVDETAMSRHRDKYRPQETKTNVR